ncbi:putative membrane protein, partial [Escherichia coli 93.0055]
SHYLFTFCYIALLF